jgi:hypothetical protein
MVESKFAGFEGADVERLLRARERCSLVDVFMMAANLPMLHRDKTPMVMFHRDLLPHLVRLVEAAATVHGVEERLGDVLGAMGRTPEVDYSGCEAIGVGGYHSLAYGDEGGRCNWCGKPSPVDGEARGG